MLFHCSRCALDFEAPAPRCPTCLRQTSVEPAGRTQAGRAELGRRLDPAERGASAPVSAPAIPMGRALVRIFGAAAISGGLLLGLIALGPVLERSVWWWPAALGVMMFAYVSVKLASGRHGSGDLPFVLVIAFSAGMALLLTLGSAAVHWVLGESSLLVKVLVGLVVFVVLVAALTPPATRLMDRVARGR